MLNRPKPLTKVQAAPRIGAEPPPPVARLTDWRSFLPHKPEPAAAPILELHNVSKRYQLGDQVLNAVNHVSLTVPRGVFLAIAGPSGSGKSTLLNLIGLIDTPTEGTIKIDGMDVTGKSSDALAPLRARTIGFIFQTFNLLPVLSAYENVEYPLLQFPDISADRRDRAIRSVLDMVGLTKHIKHRPDQLSGGQRQRVAIARALVTKPKLVLADEPTANLDRETGNEILKLMKSINRTYGTTFVFSTHDKKVITVADRVVRVADGRIEALGVRENKQWKFVKLHPQKVAPSTVRVP